MDQQFDNSLKNFILKKNNHILFFNLCKNNDKLGLFEQKDADLFISNFQSNLQKKGFLTLCLGFGVIATRRLKSKLIGNVVGGFQISNGGVIAASSIALLLGSYWVYSTEIFGLETVKKIEKKYSGWEYSPQTFDWVKNGIE